jgi:uncharacterized protein involved in outer membrane biogenesis
VKKALIGIAVLLVLLVVGVLVAPSVIDWNRYKDQITAWVEQETGRDLSIDGDLSLSLLPAPTLSASGVTFANAATGSQEPMVWVEDLDIRVALGPLLGGEVRVESVHLIRPRVVLEVLPDGGGNWQITRRASGGEGQPASGSIPSAPGMGGRSNEAPADDIAFALDSLVLEDGLVVWRDATGRETQIGDIDGRVSASSLRGPFEGALEASLRGARLAATLRTGRFGAEDAATPVFLTLELPQAGGRAQVQGRLSRESKEGSVFTGTVSADSPSFARTLAAINGVPVREPLDRPFALTGELTASATHLALDGATMRLGDTEGTGGVSVSLVDAPTVDAALAFTRVDLDALLKKASLAPSEPMSPEGGVIPAADSTVPPPNVPGGEAAVGLLPDLPAGLKGSVDVSADVITWRSGIIRAARLNATLADGEVTFNQIQAQLPGSSEINGFGFLDTRATPGRLDGTAEVKSSNLRVLLSWLGVNTDTVPADRLRRLTATAAISGTAAEVKVENLQGQLDLTHYQGAATVRTTGARPAFGVSLSLDTLNLDAYLTANHSAPDSSTGGSRSGETPSTAPASQERAPVFDGLDVLNTFDANIKARAGMLTWQDTEVRDARLDVTLLDGLATFGETMVGQVAGARLSLKGGITGFGADPVFDGLSIAVTTDDPGRISRLLNITLPVGIEQLAPVAVGATLSGPLDAVSIQSDSTLAGGSFTAEGMVRTPLGETPSFDLSLRADHGNLVSLLRRLGVSYEPQGGGDIGPLALSARASGTADDIALQDLTLRAGPSTLTGTATIRTGAERPYVSATMAADRLPLDVFRPVDRSAAVEPSGLYRPNIIPASMRSMTAVERPGMSATLAQAGAAPRWSREPLDLSGLDVVDGTFALTAGVLSFNDWILNEATLDAVLSGGRLEVPKLAGQMFGGSLDANAVLARSEGGAASLAVVTRLAGMDVGEALRAVSGERSARGRMALTADVRATGTSEYDLVSSLVGTGALTLSKVDMRRVDGSPKGSALAALLAPLRLLDRLGGGLGGESYGVDVAGEFTVEQGVVRLTEAKPLTLTSNLYNGSLAGVVSLPPWTVDAGGQVRLARNVVTELLGNAVSLPDVIPVRLSGPLGNPDVVVGTRRQSEMETAPEEKPEQRARDAVRQLLEEQLGGGQKDQPPEQKPEKVLRDALKDMLFR